MFLLAATFCLSATVRAQERFTVSGTIKDAATGEALIGAGVQVVDLNTGAMTNSYGVYSLTIPAGTYTFRWLFVGYETKEDTLAVTADLKQDVALTVKVYKTEEVVVKAVRKNDNVTSTDMGVVDIKPQEVRETPVLFGEQDVIKTIQLLPGISETGEGFSGFFVRGGNPDQNLVLLDEAPVYNASHFFGFFSVFNSDAINNVRMIKGSAPPSYGGRLSSVMDIRMKEGNNRSYHVDTGLGLIFSRLTLQGPLVKDRGSFIISGRRTYADLFLKLSRDEELRKSRLYFYDLNMKANYTLGDSDRLYVSGYFGRDLLGYAEDFSFDWGNSTATVRWNHFFNNRLFLNSSLIYSAFDYVITINDSGENIDITSGINDVNIKEDFEYFLNPDNTLSFGLNAIRHRFTPGAITAAEGATVNTYKVRDKYAWETAAYLGHEYRARKNLKLEYGLRLSMLNLIGPGETYTFDSEGDLAETKKYSDSEHIKSYVSPEPRFTASYILDDRRSVKFSLARNTQYIHLLTNTTSGTPLDIWHPSTNNIEPELATQVAAGYFRNFLDNLYETSFEAYYKDMRRLVDYRNGADILLNKYAESELVFVKGRSYGGELYIKKNTGRTTGWLSYTLSKTRRTFAAINDGKPYPSKYDRTHDFSIVGIHRFNKKWTFSATWVFHTGNAVTFPSGKYTVDGMTVNYYTERNGYRMPPYHRLDLGATWIHKKTEKYESSVNFSLYNAYGRKNAYSIYFQENEDNPDITEAVRVALFSFFPSITYNFSY